MQLLFSSAFAASALLAPPAMAQHIVQTGDDLTAVVAAASHGEWIEIQSDATFVGTLLWTGKTLTLRAGAGFSPTIQGLPGQPALKLVDSVPPARAILEGLTVSKGDDTVQQGTGNPVVPAAISFNGTGTQPEYIELEASRCTLVGRYSSGGTGQLHVTASLRDCVLTDKVALSGTGDLVSSLTLEDCRVTGGATAITTGGAKTTLRMVRTRVDGPVFTNAISTSAIDLTMESCLVVGSGTGLAGIHTGQQSTSLLTNCTVSGFPFGLSSEGSAKAHNMLLTGNQASLSGYPASDIASSLISDGTHAGLNGNFQAAAALSPAFAILSCTGPGLDAGDDDAPGLGPLDLNGAARIQDGDLDGLAHVNVGAVETPAFQPGSASVANGSGLNPVEFAAVTLPELGGTFAATVAAPAGTVLTAVFYGAPSAAYAVPGYSGEFLVTSVPGSVLDLAAGAHTIAVPHSCALMGLTLRAQAFRVDSTPAPVGLHCLNALDLVLGG